MSPMSIVDGVAVRVAGSTGTPVLLLHGIGGAHTSFNTQIPALAATHRVFAWDAPGYGESDDPATPPDMAGYADTVRRLLDTLDADPAHVVGVSWGGVIATRLALDHPRSVRSLTLVDSTRGSAVSTGSAARMRSRIGELADVGAAEFARRRAPRLTSPHAVPAVTARVESTMARVRLPGYAAAAWSMADTDHGPRLPDIGVPAHVLVGRHDEVTGVPESRLLAERIPGARLRVIDGGHAAHQEAPEQFTAAALDFFAEVDSAPRGHRTRTVGGPRIR